jgi:hypothetical protein
MATNNLKTRTRATTRATSVNGERREKWNAEKAIHDGFENDNAIHDELTMSECHSWWV